MERVVQAIRDAVPGVQAVYLFGSRARGDANAQSDLDVAVLRARPLEPIARWELQERLAGLIHHAVDLVDLRSASTVMRVNVLADSQLLFDDAKFERELFEATALSAYARLQEERGAILEQIQREGHVYA